ncbi:PGF-CTERM sorting domain-containing protein [Halobium salinum]|uniref:PGF-CTERM sorting domain-containing protein n=1 Tax=Halobium salinum TaxID=1364940 RepID=A0ABD5PA81_9EURY|nr:PGF-CTERM sorting domain-containing protein [Halobium salinum]
MSTRRVGTIAMVALLVTSVFAGFAGTGLAQEAGNGDYSIEYTPAGSDELQCMDVQAFADSEENVSEHYEYRTPPVDENNTAYAVSTNDYSSYGTQDKQVSQGSIMYVYEHEGDASLVMVHDALGESPAENAVSFDMSYDGSALEWEVRDDYYDNAEAYGSTPDDRFESTQADWLWAKTRTDGGALGGMNADGFNSVTISPAFNEDAYYGSEINATIDSWTFLTPEGEPVELDMDSDVTIHQGANCGEPVDEGGEENTGGDEETTEDDEETGDDGNDAPAGGSGDSQTTRSSPNAKAVSAQQVTATSSSAQIVPPPNGGTVTFALPSERTNGVKFQDARVGVTSNSLSFQMTSSLSAEAPNGTSAPDMPTWAYLTTSAEGSNADVTTADVTFTVTEEALDGASTDDVSVMYYTDGAWEQADANVTSEGDGMYTMTATAPAGSTLAVGLSGDGAGSQDGGNASESNETTGNETTTDEETTTSDEEETTTSDEETTTASEDTSSSDNGSEGAAQGETETQSESGGESGTTSSTSPGFGLVLTLLAVAGSALLLARRR